MSIHWTYKDYTPDDLEQGDILFRSKELDDIFSEVHPHFHDRKYSGFMITTQSCDLVRRGNKAECKTPYINLAVVRPLNAILPKLFSRVFGPSCSLDCVYPKERKTQARQFLHRLFNQNEQALGLFYLHKEPLVNILEGSVALLRVSIALKSEEHYQTLLKARKGGLTSEFQAKLGWLVGNTYSRVGTQDWPQDTLDSLTKDIIDDEDIVWFQEHCIKTAIQENIDFSNRNKEETEKTLLSFIPKSMKEKVLDEIEKQCSAVIKSLLIQKQQPAAISENDLNKLPEKIVHRLRNNSAIINKLES